MKVFLGLVFCFSLAAFPAEASQKSPRIVFTEGNAEVQVAREEGFQKASPRTVLRERAIFRTGSGGRIRIEVSKNLQIEIEPETQVSFPGISWDTGSVPVVQLEEGRIRWTESAEKTSKLVTTLFETDPPPGDFVFFLRPRLAQAGVMVLEKEISFRALNAENSVSVPAGKKVVFQGVIEEGEVAYDILLQGRKIPRGTLGKLQDLSAEDLAPFRAQQEALKKAKERAEKEARQKQAREKRAGLICKNPQGRMNDCAWVCENNPRGAKTCLTQQKGVSCLRRRCNANGEWADPQKLPADEGRVRCQAHAQVAVCDY